MANRRMISKKIIDTDEFMDLPLSTQALYMHLLLRADDDGFIAQTKTILRMTGCRDDDLKLLFAKQFLIPFETGVCVIKHWKIHNLIRRDRYEKTIYKKELSQLADNKGVYNNVIPDVIPDVIPSIGKVRLGEVRLVKDSKELKNKSKPKKNTNEKPRKPKPPNSIEEVKSYCIETNSSIDYEVFFHSYESQGWYKTNGQPVLNWKSTIKTWEKNNLNKKPKTQNYTSFKEY